MTQQPYNPPNFTQPNFSETNSVQPSGRPMGEIVAELWENTEKLVRQELELAMAELDTKVDRLKDDVLMAAVGGGVLYAGLLTIVASVVLLLSKVIDPWLSALIVGFVVSGTGYALIQKGKKDLSAENLAPDKTVQSVKRTTHTLKEAVK